MAETSMKKSPSGKRVEIAASAFYIGGTEFPIDSPIDDYEVLYQLGGTFYGSLIPPWLLSFRSAYNQLNLANDDVNPTAVYRIADFTTQFVVSGGGGDTVVRQFPDVPADAWVGNWGASRVEVQGSKDGVTGTCLVAYYVNGANVISLPVPAAALGFEATIRMHRLNPAQAVVVMTLKSDDGSIQTANSVAAVDFTADFTHSLHATAVSDDTTFYWVELFTPAAES